MTDTTATISASEPDGAPRLAGLDILRGLGIVAILFMNINDMGGSLWVLFSGDIRHFGWSAADQAVWAVREVFANGTARCLLEMLFGAGMVILAGRLTLKKYYWRNFVLFLFGVVHMFVLLWPGDILHTYGLAAMIAFLFRNRGPKLLLGVGLTMALLQLVLGGIGYVSETAKRAEVATAQAKQSAGRPLTAADTKLLKDHAESAAKDARSDAKSKARIAAEDRARTGTFSSWAGSAWDTTLKIQGKALELLFVLEAATTMLIGAALYKWGVLQGARSRAFYVRLTLVAYAIGLGSRTVGAIDDMRFDGAPSVLWSLDEVARLATTLGHVGLVYLLLATVTGTRLLKPFEAAGKTALSVYVLQTIICLWIIYPPFALGLYGTQGWAAMMATALAVSIVVLAIANWYAARFTIAPVEWAWRSIVEGRRLPIGRRGGERVKAAVAV
jgi:uncharacterized protein